MFKFGGFFLAALAVGALAFDGDRIVGGQQAKRGQFPYIVSIHQINPFSTTHFCAGSIVSDRVVITAAHCFSAKPNIRWVRIAVGAHRVDYDGDGVSHTIRRVFSHPDYVNPINDIAIVEPQVKFTFNRFVRPIELPSIDTPDHNDLPLIISGWGQFRAGQPSNEINDFPEYLQFRNLKSLSRTDCIKQLDKNNLGRLVADDMICTLNPVSKGVCNGDSGGPLVNNRNELVGVVSWGVKPCGSGMPDVYARVFAHLKFIKQTIAKISNITPSEY